MSKGEKYTSKAAKMKHEKSEGAKERKKEYGSKSKMTSKKMGKKKGRQLKALRRLPKFCASSRVEPFTQARVAQL